MLKYTHIYIHTGEIYQSGKQSLINKLVVFLFFLQVFTNRSENLKEEKHLHKVLQSNGHDNATIRAGSKELPSKDHTDTEQEKGLILTVPYIARLTESIQRVCRDFDIKTAFKSGKTLRSHLTKVKDTIPITTESSIVYSIPLQLW